jgi:hypothetical protein
VLTFSQFVFNLGVRVLGLRFTFRSRTLKRALYESWDLRAERRLQPPRELRTRTPNRFESRNGEHERETEHEPRSEK